MCVFFKLASSRGVHVGHPLRAALAVSTASGVRSLTRKEKKSPLLSRRMFSTGLNFQGSAGPPLVCTGSLEPLGDNSLP